MGDEVEPMEEADEARDDGPGSAEAFAARLIEARQKRQLSQVELAKKTGLPASSISHFEAKKRRPSFDNLSKLADALNVTADFLIGRSEDTSTAAVSESIRANLDKLDNYQLDLADQFIEMLAKSRVKSSSETN
jgi:transcriptional regulator with XRE-family HTH domain